ncbi:Swi3-domain-containing protein [Trichocladium antarcticum]|uniref:Chromosome segregation in meiosis protein n=1 Tax=Trichocladium antarcticum TaxID=1450529 RepID=A0AAN6UJ04_9PEZI|nr:Swi3-domain-containing protein [Trichocladium antarcticum]
MAPKPPSKVADSTNGGVGTKSFMKDYLADWDDDDPFRSPSPEPGRKNDDKGKKKDKTDVLGIEKELNLKKKPRAPRVKLDDTRLLSDKGIPKLRKMATRLRLKGKGHEFSDAARLLSFYQEWLDDLFPKATFLDALAMVEKAGHKTTMRSARQRWIDEGKPRSTTFDEGDEHLIYQAQPAAPQATRVAPIFDKAPEQGRAKTPIDDLFGDDDIYNATPRRNAASGTAPSRQVVEGDIPDEDDLDALMAEAESEPGAQQKASGSASVPFDSIFGDGSRKRKVAQPAGEPDEDGLDALMAEAEADSQAVPSKNNQSAVSGSIIGDGKPKPKTTPSIFEDEVGDDLDALMAEAGAGAVAKPTQAGKEKVSIAHGAWPTARAAGFDDEDDLDALMAEAEAGAGAGAGVLPPTGTKDAASTGADAVPKPPSFEDEEEAMAEMDGLW